jgi:DNA repair protein RadA/Sms
MPKSATRYICSNCGAVSQSWSGKCQQCGEWNTLQEETVFESFGTSSTPKGRKLSTVDIAKAIGQDQNRIKTNINDVDQVLGGGLVAGSVNLIAGEPGIGKSTLLLQLADELGKNNRVLYVSGEESKHQIGLRAKRLNASSKYLQLATSNSADDIVSTMAEGKYDIAIVDSIQTISTNAVGSSAGTVAQITASTQIILDTAKKTNTATILVGHVTKEGSIAGPKVLEHVVDVVLQLEGDRYSGLRVLRSTKNRFGPTSEAGIFEMKESGLKIVDNPSAILLAERQVTDGSVVLATMEGTRPILVEIQALVNKTSYGYPKRAASGIDLNRLNLLVAMLERRTKLNLSDKDIYINCVGGIRITEPSADLALCLAIGSASKGLKLKDNFVVFGEVGLSGEVRHVPFIEKRIDEAKKLGFNCAIGPKSRNNGRNNYLNEVTEVRDALNKYLRRD